MNNNIPKVGDTVRIVSISFDSLDQMFSDPNNEFYDESEKGTYKQYVGKVGIVDYSECNNYFNCVFVCVKFANDKVITVVSYDVRKTDDDPTDIEFLPTDNIGSDDEYLPLTEEEKQFADKAVMAMLSAGKFAHSDSRDIMNKAISLSICRSNMYSMLWDKTYH
jgi:hypothetical protein